MDMLEMTRIVKTRAREDEDKFRKEISKQESKAKKYRERIHTLSGALQVREERGSTSLVTRGIRHQLEANKDSLEELEGMIEELKAEADESHRWLHQGQI